MSGTQLNAATQIRAGTITLALLAAGFSLPTANLVEGALFLKKDGTVAMTAALNLGSQNITNVANGVNPGDAVNFGQLTAIANGYGTKGGADTASLINIAALSGLQTINGVTLIDGDEPFLNNQTTATQNGPWVAHSGSWTRPAWYTGTIASAGALIVVERGTYAGYSFILSTPGVITVDTTATAWVTVPTATVNTAGNGISITGNAIAVKNGNGIAFDGSQNITILPNGSSLNLSASGLKVADATSPGQVMLGGPANAAAFTTFSGDVLSVSGAGVVALSTTVRKSSSFILNELPTGTINGSNTSFTTAATPVAGTAEVYQNGVRLYPGAGNDYTIAAGTITMLTAPVTGDRLTVDYQV